MGKKLWKYPDKTTSLIAPSLLWTGGNEPYNG